MSSEKGLQADPLRRETSEQGEERLHAEERKRAAVKRSNETSEPREKRLAAKRKRKAVKRSNETSQGKGDPVESPMRPEGVETNRRAQP